MKNKPKSKGKRKPYATRAKMEAIVPSVGPSKHANATSFKKGNRFWERRATLGKEKIFSSPEHLWKAACEYFEDTINNPDYEIQVKGKYNELVEVPHTPPFTKEALCIFLGVNTSYLRLFKARVKDDPGYSTVLKQIDNIIFSQQYNGGMNGVYNPNLTKAYLGLVEKQDVTSGGEPVKTPEIKVYNTAPPMARDEKEVDTKKDGSK